MQIIHGDNQIASRNHFLSQKTLARSKGCDLIELSGNNITLTDLVTASTSISLLGIENAVFIDGLFSRRPSNDKKSLIDYLQSHLDSQIVTYDAKDVSSQLKSFNPKSIIKFDLPKFVFEFVDTFDIKLFTKSLSASEPEMILGLLAKRIHDLLLVKEHKLTMPSWQQSKLESQAKKYSVPQLINMNTQLLEIDYKQKTSGSPVDLKSALEIWLIKTNSVIASKATQSLIL